MLHNEEILGIVLLSQIVVGVLGNAFLLSFHMFNLITNHYKPIDLIFIHLSLINIMFLLSIGIPRIITSLEMITIFDDIECKMAIYIGRVFRGLCLYNNCLLSTFQAITISTNNLMCGLLKVRALQYIIPSLFLCWILNLLIYVAVPISMIIPKNHTIIKNRWSHRFCAFDLYASNFLKNRMWTSIYDAMWCGLIICVNFYIIAVMKRHHQRVLHNINFRSSRVSPEIRAAKTILILISSFVCFNLLSYTLFYVFLSSLVTKLWIIYVSLFLSGCFSTLSPFILICTDTRVHKVYIPQLWTKIPLIQLSSQFQIKP